MYCENCGTHLENQYLYCFECGTKVNKSIVCESKSSNNILWIILGCFLGIPILIGILMFFLSLFIIVDNKQIIENKNYEINEYYDYENINNNYFYKDDREQVVIIK